MYFPPLFCNMMNWKYIQKPHKNYGKTYKQSLLLVISL